VWFDGGYQTDLTSKLQEMFATMQAGGFTCLERLLELEAI
jgi:hypothetical protein